MLQVRIRPETPEDREAIRRVNELAFGRPREAEIVDKLRASEGYLPELSFAAERDSEIVGHALFSEVTIEGEDKSWIVLALGPIAVLPVCQRQGVGTQLSAAGLEHATDLGYGAVLLIGHPTYYPRFGYVPASTFHIMPGFSVPDEVFMARPLRAGGLDGVRGSFVFPPAFDE